MKGPEYIRCGDSHPNPSIEDIIAQERTLRDAPKDDGCACGDIMHWTLAYRCVECGRFYHHDCIKAHFAAHKTLVGV
jgi:hypothetical protein